MLEGEREVGREDGCDGREAERREKREEKRRGE